MPSFSSNINIENSTVGQQSYDETGNIPLSYSDRPTTNKANISGPLTFHDLAFAGSSNVDITGVVNPALPSEYTKTDANVTPGGHLIEYNDTPGGERIRFKHKSGAGIDMLPDGSIAIAVKGKHVLTVMDDMTVVIMGNTNYEFNGDLNFNVKGDFNLNCTNFNTNVTGNKTDNINGALRETIGTNRGEIIKGNHSVTTLGSSTSTIVGNSSSIVKGSSNIAAQGKMQILGGGAVKMSAQGGFDLSSTNINIAGNSTTVIGSTGTFGGAGIVMYGKGATFGEGVTAPTFTGSLKGTAEKSITSDVTNSQNYADPDPGGGVGAAQGYTITNTATPTTALPNGALMTEYLTVSSKGIINVTVDDAEIIKMVDRSQFNGGTSSGTLGTTQVRSKLRDEANLNNTEFVSNMVASGVLSPQYSQTTAPGMGRTVGKAPTPTRGSTYMGAGNIDASQGVYQPAPPSGKRKFAPDLKYIVGSSTNITQSTLLAKGIPLSMFIAGEGDRASINHITNMDQRRQIARNLQAQVQILLYVNGSHRSQFTNYTLKVIEGLYKPGGGESVTANGLNDLAMQGRSVVYELINNSTGKVDPALTFELATALRSTALYDKLILDYDNYSPDGSMNVQLIVTTPQLGSNYEGTFKFEIESRYNGNVQSTELVEILSEPAGSPVTASSPAGAGTASPQTNKVVTSSGTSGPTAIKEGVTVTQPVMMAPPTRAQLRAEQLGYGSDLSVAEAAALFPNS